MSHSAVLSTFEPDLELLVLPKSYTLARVKFLTRAILTHFRCHVDADLTLDHANVFAGPNNSGKSAVLMAIRRLASVNINRHARVADRAGVGFYGPSSQLRLVSGDIHDGESSSRFTLYIGKDLPLADGAPRPERVHARFYPERGTSPARGTSLWVDDQRDPVQPDSVDQTAQAIVQALERLPLVLIPENRALPRQLQVVRPQDDQYFHESTVTAGDLLAYLVVWSCEAHEKITQLCALAGEMLDEEVAIAVRPGASTFEVGIGSEAVRDIHDVGAGIVEVLTIAAALTNYDRGLLLYEEPELHLHPRVQRRVVEKLCNLSTLGPWQIMLTTHSNHVLDGATDRNVAVFSVARSGGSTTLGPVHERAKIHGLLNELGVRPSSGLQPQALIWVEGPSDAEYLRYFLECAPGARLIEFVDYAFAFFGGSLLKHQVAAWTPPPALLDLFGIHRNSFIVLDSDRAKQSVHLGKSYADEFIARSDVMRVWVTWGREMENYLPDEVLFWAAAEGQSADVCAKLIRSSTIDRQFDVFHEQVRTFAQASGRERASHDASDDAKPRFAKSAVKYMRANLSTDWTRCGDLRTRVEALAAFIRHCRDT